MLDPRIGRWLSIDSQEKEGPEYSPYNYAFNNPTNLIDPDGEWPTPNEWKAFGKGFVKGVVIGIVAAVVITAVVASAGAAGPAIAYAAGAYGAYQVGKTGIEIATGKEAYTGKKLTKEERYEKGGEILGGFVGGVAGVKGVKMIKASIKTKVSIVDEPLVETGTVKPYSKSRPNYGKDQVKEVWEAAKQKDGKVYDENTGKELKWSKEGKREWDMGHKPGMEYRKLHQDYMDGKITKEKFLEVYRDPKNYRPESPSANRSGKYESK